MKLESRHLVICMLLALWAGCDTHDPALVREEDPQSPRTNLEVFASLTASDTLGAPGYTTQIMATCSSANNEGEMQLSLFDGSATTFDNILLETQTAGQLETSLAFEVREPLNVQLRCTGAGGHGDFAAVSLTGFPATINENQLPSLAITEGAPRRVELPNVIQWADEILLLNVENVVASLDYASGGDSAVLTLEAPLGSNDDFSLEILARNGFGFDRAVLRGSIEPDLHLQRVQFHYHLPTLAASPSLLVRAISPSGELIHEQRSSTGSGIVQQFENPLPFSVLYAVPEDDNLFSRRNHVSESNDRVIPIEASIYSKDDCERAVIGGSDALGRCMEMTRDALFSMPDQGGTQTDANYRRWAVLPRMIYVREHPDTGASFQTEWSSFLSDLRDFWFPYYIDATFREAALQDYESNLQFNPDGSVTITRWSMVAVVPENRSDGGIRVDFNYELGLIKNAVVYVPVLQSLIDMEGELEKGLIRAALGLETSEHFDAMNQMEFRNAIVSWFNGFHVDRFRKRGLKGGELFSDVFLLER